jgi:hypothetical protein
VSRLSREVFKERIKQAAFDALEEIDMNLEIDVEKQAEIIADVIYNVITETDTDELEELDPSNYMEDNEASDEELSDDELEELS